MGGAVFIKTQAPSRISLMISASKVVAVNVRALGTTQAWMRRSQRD